MLVTGIARGLGHALFLEALRAGACVAGCVRRAADAERVASEARRIDGDADRFAVAVADVTDADAMARFVEGAEARWGAVHGLIVNASVLDERAPLRDVDPAEWRRTVDVNLNGAFNVCRAAVPAMRRAGGGSIVVVSSGAADRPRRDWGAYAVSKHAVEALARNLALEERDAGVRVNVVDPGAMRTGMRAAAYPDEDPATLPDPAAHAGLYLWLLGDASAGVTGERFVARDWRPPA